jgi:hypothetical protein
MKKVLDDGAGSTSYNTYLNRDAKPGGYGLQNQVREID